MRVDWTLGQALFWLLVVAIIFTGVISIRRSGAVLAAHQGALVAGRDTAQEGMAQAGQHLGAWWGVDRADTYQVVEVMERPEQRSVLVIVRGVMEALFGDEAVLGAGSFQRREDFYAGPPTEDGWE
jgi:hypothetical protein